MNAVLDQTSRLFFGQCPAHGLAAVRIAVGTLLLVDLVYERGLSRAELIWGNANECRFPLFDGLRVLPMRAMLAIYSLMFIGNVGIILGFRYKLSCLLYLCCYWYLFALDKSRWNNHSYLFGLLVLLLAVSDANYHCSIDYGLRSTTLKARSVPFWQYFLLRSQVFLVYFIAGLKKIDSDWLYGYSMNQLSDHWVFSPFKIVLSSESIDLYVVHIGGFLFDLTIGFLLVYHKSRSIAYLLCLAFNLMNSRLFSIGVFPYMMIAVMPVFSAPDWPKSVAKKLLSNCYKQSSDEEFSVKEIERQSKRTMKEKLTLLLICLYLSVQVTLPHSHWLTRGYNTWTNGLYGYSWDMMVHNWRHIHTRVTVVDKFSRKFYLNPEAWTKSARWSHHSDMVKQYALCAHHRLTTEYNVSEPQIYIDSWISLNGRFAQRVYDPRVDIVTAEWSAFARPQWVLPVLSHLTEWRQRIKSLEETVIQQNSFTSLVFIADFPGLSLSNYIDTDFDNMTLLVMKGWLKVEIQGLNDRIMTIGDRLTLPGQRFHKLTPIRSEPAAYVFIFGNGSQHIPSEVINIDSSIRQSKDSDKYSGLWLKRYNIV